MLVYGGENLPNKMIQIRQKDIDILTDSEDVPSRAKYLNTTIMELLTNIEAERHSKRASEKFAYLPSITSSAIIKRGLPTPRSNEQVIDNYIQYFIKSKTPQEIKNYFKTKVLSLEWFDADHISAVEITNLDALFFGEDIADYEVSLICYFFIYSLSYFY